MDRSQKADAVAQLNAVFNEVGVVVVTRNLGMTVEQSTELRGKMRDAGASYKVAKNRLAKLALKDTDYTGLEEFLSLQGKHKVRVDLCKNTRQIPGRDIFA